MARDARANAFALDVDDDATRRDARPNARSVADDVTSSSRRSMLARIEARMVVYPLA